MTSAILMLLLFFTYTGLWSQEQVRIDSDKIDEVVNTIMEEGDIPGLSIIIVSPEKTMIKSYGFADVDEQRKVTPETLFELASNSKAFTALAIQILVDEGKLSLDDEVSKYLPDFSVTYDGKQQTIKIKHLLHHTSGIPWETISKIPASTAKDALAQTVAKLQGLELSSEPGSTYEYTTINYDVLALVAQKITNKSFESFITEQVFNPLGLTNTTIGIPKDSLLLAQGYKPAFFGAREYDAPRYKGNNAAGYVISDANDMATWLALQLGIEESSMTDLIVKTQQRDTSVAPHGLLSYAQGWEVSLSGNNEIFHSGINPNFSSHIILRPNEKFGVAVLTNTNSNYTSLLANQLTNVVLNKEINNDVMVDDNSDGFFSMLFIALSVYTLIVFAYIIMAFLGWSKGKRSIAKVNGKKIKQFCLAVLAAIPFLLGIYIIPEVMAGFNWDSMLVWTPGSFEMLIYMILGVFGISYVAYLVGMLLPEENYYKSRIPKILLFSIISGLANVMAIILITSALQTNIQLKYLVFYYGLVLAIYLFGRRFVQIRLTKMAVNLVYDMRMKVISKVLKTSYQKLEAMDNGRIFTVINDDTNSVGRYASLFVSLITSTITIIGAFVYLFSISLWATGLVLIVMILLTVLYQYVGKSAHRFFEEARDERNIFMGLISALVDGLKEISQHYKKKREYEEDLSKSAHRFKEKNFIADVKFINGFLVGESLLLLLLGMVSMGLPKLFPYIPFYTLMSFVIILLYLIGPINGVLNSIPEVMRLKVSYDRIRNFLKEIPADLEDDKHLESLEIPEVKSLAVKDVEFTYKGDEKDRKNFSIGPVTFEAKAGEVIFITGGNGSGKTTLAKILTGLYKPDAGVISINGEEIPNVEMSEYFSTVFNPPYLFKKLYGIDTEGKEEQIAYFLNKLGLKEKVSLTNNEFSTIELSSGQRKRLGLLQCYLQDSPILLFDEWAADQDPEFRQFFYRTIIREMKAAGKLIIAISHDDFYYDVADKIVEMREGRSTVVIREKSLEKL